MSYGIVILVIFMNIDGISVKVCKSFSSRFLGLMFKKDFNYGLVFPKCNSIHTIFMRKCIDVFMTDINGKVLYTYKSLKPYKIILPKKNVYYTFEFPEGKIDINKSHIDI